jgi:putative MATE family efflux protein
MTDRIDRSDNSQPEIPADRHDRDCADCAADMPTAAAGAADGASAGHASGEGASAGRAAAQQARGDGGDGSARRGPSYVGTEGEQVGRVAATVRRRVDMTQGPLLRGIFALSWPIVATSLLQVAVGIADIKMVGALGPEQIAAVGMSNSVVFILMGIAMAVATGMQVLVAQYSGRGDTDGMDKTVKQGLMVAVAIGLGLVTPVGLIFSPRILELLGASEAVLADGIPYMRLIFSGVLLMVVSFIVTSALQGAGDTLTPLVLLLVANSLNIAFNWLLIFGVGPFPRMGVAGAAMATLIARAFAAIVGLIILSTGKFAVTLSWRSSWAINWRLLGRIWSLGVPAAIQHVSRNLGGMLVLRILSMTSMGMIAISGFTVANQVHMVTGMVGLAMMASATTSVGQNMGARKISRAVRATWATVAVAATISTLAALTYATFARFFIGIFTTDAKTLMVGVEALVIMAFAEPFMTAAMSMSGSLRGAGDAMTPMYVTVSVVLLVTPTLCYLLSVLAGMDTLGVWVGLTVSEVLRFSTIALVFRSGRWKKIRLVDI